MTYNNKVLIDTLMAGIANLQIVGVFFRDFSIGDKLGIEKRNDGTIGFTMSPSNKKSTVKLSVDVRMVDMLIQTLSVGSTLKIEAKVDETIGFTILQPIEKQAPIVEKSVIEKPVEPKATFSWLKPTLQHFPVVTTQEIAFPNKETVRVISSDIGNTPEQKAEKKADKKLKRKTIKESNKKSEAVASDMAENVLREHENLFDILKKVNDDGNFETDFDKQNITDDFTDVVTKGASKKEQCVGQRCLSHLLRATEANIEWVEKSQTTFDKTVCAGKAFVMAKDIVQTLRMFQQTYGDNESFKKFIDVIFWTGSEYSPKIRGFFLPLEQADLTTLIHAICVRLYKQTQLNVRLTGDMVPLIDELDNVLKTIGKLQEHTIKTKNGDMIVKQPAIVSSLHMLYHNASDAQMQINRDKAVQKARDNDEGLRQKIDETYASGKKGSKISYKKKKN